jgi:hypothetical protein
VGGHGERTPFSGRGHATCVTRTRRWKWGTAGESQHARTRDPWDRQAKNEWICRARAQIYEEEGGRPLTEFVPSLSPRVRVNVPRLNA